MNRSVTTAAAAAVVAALAATTATACTRPADPGDDAADAARRGLAVVTRVVDGDTLEVDLAGREERVRLLGIDTPESVAPDRPVQCYGPEASQALAQLVPAGTEVRLVLDLEARDRFGRLLAYAYREGDELFVNRWLIDEGFAAAVVYEPNDAHAPELIAAEAVARRAGRGLWGVCDGPDQPLD